MDVAEDIEALELMAPGSTYVRCFIFRRLHRGGGLFRGLKSSLYDSVIHSESPIVVSGIDGVFGCVSLIDAFLAGSAVAPVLVSPVPFLQATLRTCDVWLGDLML